MTIPPEAASENRGKEFFIKTVSLKLTCSGEKDKVRGGLVGNYAHTAFSIPVCVRQEQAFGCRSIGWTGQNVYISDIIEGQKSMSQSVMFLYIYISGNI